MSKTRIYELIAKGELEVVRLGGSTFITLYSAHGLIARNIGRAGDKLSVEGAKKAARETSGCARKKKRLVPGKLRTRAARGAAGAGNEGGGHLGQRHPGTRHVEAEARSRQRRKSERRSRSGSRSGGSSS